MSETNMAPPPPAPDYSGVMGMNVMASVDKMAMQVGGQVLQTQMMTSMMNLQSMNQMMLQQDKLDAKMEIASMNFDYKIQNMELGHRERMTELANRHVETLVDQGVLERGDDAFDGIKYPYQWGSGA